MCMLTCFVWPFPACAARPTSPGDMVCMSHAYDTNARPLDIRTLVSNVDVPLEIYGERRVSDR